MRERRVKSSNAYDFVLRFAFGLLVCQDVERLNTLWLLKSSILVLILNLNRTTNTNSFLLSCHGIARLAIAPIPIKSGGNTELASVGDITLCNQWGHEARHGREFRTLRRPWCRCGEPVTGSSNESLPTRPAASNCNTDTDRQSTQLKTKWSFSFSLVLSLKNNSPSVVTSRLDCIVR